MSRKENQLKAVAPNAEQPLFALSAQLADGVNYFCGIVRLQSGLKATEWDTDKTYSKKMILPVAERIAQWLKDLNNIENVKIELDE